MTLTEIRQKCRNMLDDVVGDNSDRYWSDAELNEFINTAVEQMCIHTRCLTDSITNSVCLIPLVAGQTHYAISELILHIQTVQPSWQKSPLSRQSVVTVQSDWLDNKGLPYSYLMDYSNGMLSITSTPEAVTTESLRLTVNRLPLAELSASTDKPEIHRQYHRRLVDGVLSQAFFKQDSEIFNPSKGKYHADKWEQSLDEIIRLEARLKPRISIARRAELC